MSERLTERDEYGNADIIGVDSSEFQGSLEFDELNLVTNALNKLADYEEAEREGRVVITDTIFKAPNGYYALAYFDQYGNFRSRQEMSYEKLSGCIAATEPKGGLDGK